MTLRLDDRQTAILAGAEGSACAFAMRLLARFAEAVRRGAPHSTSSPPISTAASITARPASISSSAVANAGGSVRVPTTLNVGSVDLVHPGAVSAGRGVARGRHAADAGARGARLPAHLHLRALPDAVSTALRRPDRLGRIERDRLRQFGDRRAHQSLWRFHRSLLRDDRPRAGLRPASRRKPPGRALVVAVEAMPPAWDGTDARGRRRRPCRRAALRRAHPGDCRPAAPDRARTISRRSAPPPPRPARSRCSMPSA